MRFKITEEIWKEGNMYVSHCPELDVSSCGHNIEAAKQNLKETIQIYIEETQKMGTFERFIEECGLDTNEEGAYYSNKELIDFSSIEVAV